MVYGFIQTCSRLIDHAECMADAVPSFQDQRLYFPATCRNREPIASVLAAWLPAVGDVLEVASGSGEHAVFFQQRFPNLRWQATDSNPEHLASIRSWQVHHDLDQNMPQPLLLDVQDQPWSLECTSRVSAIVAINLIHIAPWSCCRSLVCEAARLLPADSPLVLYGPFRQRGQHSSDSNQVFDRSLRSRCPAWGVRDLEAVETLASGSGFASMRIQAMPANNLAVCFFR